MSKLLHIKASPRGEDSYSLQAAEVFLDSYRSVNPDDNIEEVDLWGSDLASFDPVAVSGKYKIMHGLDHSEGEARAWKSVEKTIEQFMSADKVLISTGMWNFSIPYRLKQYIDVIIQPTYTFSFDPDKGYSGLVKDTKLQLILASGDQYPEGTEMAGFDFQKPYLETVFGFIGITDIDTIRVEGTLSPSGPDNLEKAKGSLSQAGKNF